MNGAIHRWFLAEIISRFREDRARPYAGVEQPLRSVLFSADQMRDHGRILAGSHVAVPKRVSGPLLLMTRLAENEAVLLEVRTILADAIKVNRRITPAGEWLLDNFYLIEEQIRTARRHLPKSYSRELPRLRNGPSAGLPRVYDIALETISHGDGRVDPENLSSFVEAYQSVSILKLGELWAIPIMLRLALIENLRRVAARIASDMAEQNRADYWADQDDRNRGEGPEKPYSCDRGNGAFGPSHGQFFCRGTYAPAAGTELRPCIAADLDRAAAALNQVRRSSSWCNRRSSSRPPTRCR